MPAPRIRGALALVAVAAFAAACGSSDGGTNPNGCTTPMSPASGTVTDVSGAASVCADGSTSGAEYELVAFNSDTGVTAKPITFSASGEDTAAAVAPSNLLPSSGVSLGSFAPTFDRGEIGAQFDAKLRATERRVLGPRMRGAQANYARGESGARFSMTPGAARTTAVPAVGSYMTLNANANQACSNPLPITAQVKAVSGSAIVVADTANPSGGFSDADYQSIAITFDTLVNSNDTSYFGSPTDIDANGHVILFFTKEVNRLTPANANGIIGGFFFSRDLFPTTDPSGQGNDCATSNYAEMFYLLVPDVSGTINNNVRSLNLVQQSTIGTTAHEYQHLINASRRLYVNTSATSFEDTYLDEGLAHIAEELLFYRASGYTPKMDLNYNANFHGNQRAVDAINNYQINNLGRYELYLKRPEIFGPFAHNDSLETRGAIWNALRYLADRSGNSDRVTFHALVNSTTAGVDNLQHVFGNDLMSQLRDWSVAQLTDDISANFPITYQQQSWSWADLFQRLGDPAHPLLVHALNPTTSTASVSLKTGGSAYIKFRVAAGHTAQVDWNSSGAAVSNKVYMTLVRTH